MKNVKKITLLLIMILLIGSFINVIAFSADTTNPTSIISDMEGTSDMASTSNSVGNALNTIIGILQLVGTGISLVVISLLGIKYMLASPSEKADVKKSITPIIIGCILLFGAVQLVAAVQDLAEKSF